MGLEIVKYHNNMNEVQFGILNASEMNIFFALCAKVKDNASFLMEKEPITVDGTKYFKIMLSSPIIVKRSPSKKATIDKR